MGCAPTGSPGAACWQACATTIPRRFHHVEGRFTSPVYPGEALTVSMWETGAGEAVFITSVGERAVIDQGLVRFT